MKIIVLMTIIINKWKKFFFRRKQSKEMTFGFAIPKSNNFFYIIWKWYETKQKLSQKKKTSIIDIIDSFLSICFKFFFKMSILSMCKQKRRRSSLALCVAPKWKNDPAKNTERDAFVYLWFFICYLNKKPPPPLFY